MANRSRRLRRGDKADKLEKFANFLEPQKTEEHVGLAAEDAARRLPRQERGAHVPLCASSCLGDRLAGRWA